MIERILLFISLIVILVLLGGLLLQSTESNYHYCYIDSNYNLGVASRCRKDQCEDLDFNVLSVRDYIDIRKK